MKKLQFVLLITGFILMIQSCALAEDAQETEIFVEMGDDIHKFRYKQQKFDP